MTSNATTHPANRFGAMGAAVQQVLDTVKQFTFDQHMIMFHASAAAWDTDLPDDWEDAWEAVIAAVDTSGREQESWNAREDALLATGGEETWGAVDDAVQAELVSDLIAADAHRLLTSLFRLARDHAEWSADPAAWSSFLELVPALGIDGAREVVERGALPAG